MKKLLLLSLLAFYAQINAQNVGIGNPAPTEKLDVTGNINVTGTIKANGAGGMANQVLAKNASNNLAWVNTANANNTRFAFFLSGVSLPSTGQNLNINTDFYNLNNSNIYYMVGSPFISINKSGLYHFDIDIQTNATTGVTPSVFPQFNAGLYEFGGANKIFRFNVGNVAATSANNSTWSLQGSKSFDVYLEAGSTYQINCRYLYTSTNNLNMVVLGHLISE
jgi:hypothetical protein